MPVTYEQLRSMSETGVPFAYDERDTMLYALSVGMGRDPTDEAELRYVFEGRDLRVVPRGARSGPRARASARSSPACPA